MHPPLTTAALEAIVRPRLALRIDAAIARHRRAPSTNPRPKTAA